nr:hypothetical protein CFP56_19722 [Quercus suber]
MNRTALFLSLSLSFFVPSIRSDRAPKNPNNFSLLHALSPPHTRIANPSILVSLSFSSVRFPGVNDVDSI